MRKNKKIIGLTVAFASILLGISAYGAMRYFSYGYQSGTTDFLTAYSGSSDMKDGIALSACGCSAAGVSITASPFWKDGVPTAHISWSASEGYPGHGIHCVASGDWSGTYGGTGQVDVAISGAGSKRFDITCHGDDNDNGPSYCPNSASVSFLCVNPPGDCDNKCGSQKRRCLFTAVGDCDKFVDCGSINCGPCSDGKWKEVEPQ